MIRTSLLVLFFSCISLVVFCQVRDNGQYLENVVDIGEDDFGFITGGSDGFVYFVAIRQRNEIIAENIPVVKFFQKAFKTDASLLTKWPVGDYIVALYQTKYFSSLKWQRDSYDYMNPDMGTFTTFLDNGKSDNLWSRYRERITLANWDGSGVGLLKMAANSVFSRGMPVFNDAGSVVALVADKGDDDEKVIFNCIDFKILETKMTAFSRCKHFEMRQHNQKYTVCEIADNKQSGETKTTLKAERKNKVHTIAIGPTIGANFEFASGKDKAGMGGLGYFIGLNFYLWPDNVKTRLTFKPRFAKLDAAPPDGYTYPSGVGYDPVAYRLTRIEMPIVLELVTSRGRKSNYFFGIGYNPGLLQKVRIDYASQGQSETSSEVPVKDKIYHKVIAELGFEYSNFRFTFAYNYLLTPWTDFDYRMNVQGESIAPFLDIKKSTHSLGIEFAWRFGGSWLIKDK